MKLNKHLIWLFVVLLFSFLIRIYHIDNLSLFGDEIDVGYQAFSLINTGKDYKGNFLPVYTESLSEARAPLLIYLSIPGIKIFGLNELGVRVTPVIFGVLSLYFLYKLIFLLSKSHKLAILSSIILSVSPWHFHYSRASFEVTLLLLLILGGTYFIFKYFESSKNKFLYSSIILFCLSFYTYNTANIFVPLLVIFVFISNFPKFKSKLKFKSIIFSFLIFFLITSPLLHQIFLGNAANRFNLISIFHDSKTIENIINKRNSFSAINPTVESIFHNKPIAWSQQFIKNYLSSFSLPFLFNHGDQINIRHNIAGFGLLSISFVPFLFLGLFALNLKEKQNKLMLFWLLISPIAASFTSNGGNHATRLFLMLVPLVYFISLGILKIFNSKFIFKKILLLFFCFTLIGEIILYSHEYFVHYPKDFSNSWNFGYEELFKNIPINSSNRIFISNSKFNSLLPFLFYQQISPNTLPFIQDHEKPNIIDDMSGFNLTNQIYFINNWHHQNEIFNKINGIAQTGDTFVLFQLNEIPGDMDLSVASPLENFKVIKVVFNPNGSILGQIIQKQ